MKIGAIQKFSLIDYPGKICAIIFSQGCNFRCPYCHNPELVLPEFFAPCIEEEDIFQFLEKRKRKLDAVSISGGEPTLQPDLSSFIQKAKGLGYAVKLDTNGSKPEVIQKLLSLGLLDYIAMDIKAPLSKYAAVIRAPVQTERIELSIRIIRESGIDHEFRTTIAKPLLHKDDLMEIAALTVGGRCIFQKFVPSKPIDAAILQEVQYTDAEYAGMLEELKRINPEVCIR